MALPVIVLQGKNCIQDFVCNMDITTELNISVNAINVCSFSPCQNSGRCFSSDSDYVCLCSHDFIGKHCKTNSISIQFLCVNTSTHINFFFISTVGNCMLCDQKVLNGMNISIVFMCMERMLY